jgi:BirA family biotin operon repressor/biotin-[acetyl-CoA-carboxylase] ligase
VQNSDKFGTLDIEIDKKKLVYKFIDKILQFPKWREIFDKYSIEFYKYQNFNFHENNELKSLQDAKLNSDGSIDVDNKTIYSLR